MRLFRLEIKRILKSRRTLIILAIALLLSVAMAYLPISFEGINRPNEDGTVTELDGLAAIKYKQDLYKKMCIRDRNIFSRQIYLWDLIWKHGLLCCITSINFD